MGNRIFSKLFPLIARFADRRKVIITIPWTHLLINLNSQGYRLLCVFLGSINCLCLNFLVFVIWKSRSSPKRCAPLPSIKSVDSFFPTNCASFRSSPRCVSKFFLVFPMYISLQWVQKILYISDSVVSGFLGWYQKSFQLIVPATTAKSREGKFG